MLTIDDDESDPYFYEPDDHTPCALAPPEAFSDEPAPREWVDLLWPDQDPERYGTQQRRSGVTPVQQLRRLARAADGPRAVRGDTRAPTYSAAEEHRQLSSIMWAAEATPREVFEAWAEHAYTWR